jgi:hypothetical protein
MSSRSLRAIATSVCELLRGDADVAEEAVTVVGFSNWAPFAEIGLDHRLGVVEELICNRAHRRALHRPEYRERFIEFIRHGPCLPGIYMIPTRIRRTATLRMAMIGISAYTQIERAGGAPHSAFWFYFVADQIGQHRYAFRKVILPFLVGQYILTGSRDIYSDLEELGEAKCLGKIDRWEQTGH